MAKIRVDQPHCNYYFSAKLAELGWALLFTDSGAVSRGGTGYQGPTLRVFESTGLPIPDVVATKDRMVLVVEIDSNVRVALPSIEAYLGSSRTIIDGIARLTGTASDTLVVGFCKTGITRSPQAYVDKASCLSPQVDVWAVFDAPRSPVLLGGPFSRQSR